MDIITVKPVKDSPKEKVRQEIARQLIFEYQIAPCLTGIETHKRRDFLEYDLKRKLKRHKGVLAVLIDGFTSFGHGCSNGLFLGVSSFDHFAVGLTSKNWWSSNSPG